MAQEPFIFRAVRQQLLWPPIHAAIDVYQRRRASKADHYELIWRLIHIWECTAITLASAAIARIRELGMGPEFLKLRERSYGLMWNTAEGSLEKSQGALDGSIDKWIEMLHTVAGFSVSGSTFLAAVQRFLTAPPGASGGVDSAYCIDLDALARAWGRACDVPPNVAGNVNVKDAFQAINSFRNRFAHVPFPYDQLQDVFRELETCTFRLFEIPPSAANDGSPLSGRLAFVGSWLRGSGYCKPEESWQDVKTETYVWGNSQSDLETWDARPFVFLDKMMRSYVLSRLRNEAGSWEYIRYLAEANAVYVVSDPDLLKLLPRPTENDYLQRSEEGISAETAPPEVETTATQVAARPLQTREEAFAASKERKFEPVIEFWANETRLRPSYHSGWHRLGYAQREYGVDLMELDRLRAEQLLRDSLRSFDHAVNHIDPQFSAEAHYNRSKSYWRLWRLNGDQNDLMDAIKDADEAARGYYDPRFVSWYEFVKGNA